MTTSLITIVQTLHEGSPIYGAFLGYTIYGEVQFMPSILCVPADENCHPTLVRVQELKKEGVFSCSEAPSDCTLETITLEDSE